MEVYSILLIDIIMGPDNEEEYSTHDQQVAGMP
jgi:hypothetical protein